MQDEYTRKLEEIMERVRKIEKVVNSQKGESNCVITSCIHFKCFVDF